MRLAGARRLLRRADVPAPVSVTATVLSLLGLIATLWAGGIAGALWLLITGALVLFAARRAATEGDAVFVVGLVGFAFLARALLAAVLDIALVAHGSAGALFLDDAGYLRLAAEIAKAWHDGTPLVGTDPSLDNNYVRLAAALFFALGPNTVLLKLVNTAFGVLTALMVYRTMVNLRLPGARVGLLVVLVFPSLVLWSALALKDAYVLFFAVAPVWLMTEYRRTRRLAVSYILIVGSLLAIYNVRAYMFVILAVAWPLAVPLMADRIKWVLPTVTATVLAALLLATTPALTYINPNLLTAAEYVRQAMAANAHSGFVEPPPVIRGNPGDRFTVTAPGRTPVPLEERRTITVLPGQDLVLEGADSTAVNDRAAVLVRPGDVIVIGPQSTPAPTGIGGATTRSETPSPVSLSVLGRNVVSSSAPAQTAVGRDDSLTLPHGLLNAIQYLPRGVLYVIGAPVPVAAHTLQDAATIPEMLMWYLCEMFALWGMLVLLRERRFEYAYGVLALVAIGVVLSLFEGNVGTLVRHRGMMIPFVAVLSAVGFARLLNRLDRFTVVRTLIGQ